MKRRLLILALVSTVVYGGSRVLGTKPAPADSELLVLDRIWIDHVPRSERETFHVFAALEREPTGIFNATSLWRGQYERFTYAASGNELRVLYPQTGERETLTHRARRCREHQMDFCLDLEGGSRGVKRYYSRKGWELDGLETPAQVLARIEAKAGALRLARGADAAPAR